LTRQPVGTLKSGRGSAPKAEGAGAAPDAGTEAGADGGIDVAGPAGGGACDPTCDAACGDDSIAMAANNIGTMFWIMACTSRQIDLPNYTTADSSMRSVPASASSSTSTPTGKVNCLLM
jgi:hypothetical protein